MLSCVHVRNFTGTQATRKRYCIWCVLVFVIAIVMVLCSVLKWSHGCNFPKQHRCVLKTLTFERKLHDEQRCSTFAQFHVPVAGLHSFATSGSNEANLQQNRHRIPYSGGGRGSQPIGKSPETTAREWVVAKHCEHWWGRSWRGVIPYLCVVMCLTQDHVKVLVLTRAYILTQQELDARHNESR